MNVVHTKKVLRKNILQKPTWVKPSWKYIVAGLSVSNDELCFHFTVISHIIASIYV